MTKIVAGMGKLVVQEMESFEWTNQTKMSSLVASFKKNGYLLLRNLNPDGSQAKTKILEFLKELGHTNDNLDIPEDYQVVEQGWRQTKVSPQLMSHQDWIRSQPQVMQYLESEQLVEFMDCFLTKLYPESEISTTVPFKWLRAVGTGLFTGLHCDHVYVGDMADKMVTAWIPFDDVPMSKGSLVVAAGSHSDKTWQPVRDTYATQSVGKDGTLSGWLCMDPNDIYERLADDKVKWVSTNFQLGDICLLHLKVMHMTATNITDQWRLSCDTRWAVF